MTYENNFWGIGFRGLLLSMRRQMKKERKALEKLLRQLSAGRMWLMENFVTDDGATPPN